VYLDINMLLLLQTMIFFKYQHWSVINEHLCYSTETTVRVGEINILLQTIVSCNTAFDSALFAE